MPLGLRLIYNEILRKRVPKGFVPKNNKQYGAYINQTLADNLNVYAKQIVKDMHFLIIISGNDAVGNGKSTLATHVGAYLTNKINEFKVGFIIMSYDLRGFHINRLFLFN